MKFDERFPEAASVRVAFPGNLMGPHPEVEVIPGFISQSWRVYPCVACKAPTGWRSTEDDCPVPCCSEECLGVLNTWKRPACSGCQHLLHEDEAQTRCLASDREGVLFCDCLMEHRKSAQPLD